jgi:hypothetical protein
MSNVLWQQQSPFVASHLTQGLFRWRQVKTLKTHVFLYTTCQLETDIEEWKRGEVVDFIQLDLDQGQITLSTSRKWFVGSLGWNIWQKGKCVWNMKEGCSFGSALFQFQERTVDMVETHHFDCLLTAKFPPFSMGEYVPSIIINWRTRVIRGYDDPTGRIAEGRLGWCILYPIHDTPPNPWVQFQHLIAPSPSPCFMSTHAGSTPYPSPQPLPSAAFQLPPLILPPLAQPWSVNEGSVQRYLSDGISL